MDFFTTFFCTDIELGKIPKKEVINVGLGSAHVQSFEGFLSQSLNLVKKFAQIDTFVNLDYCAYETIEKLKRNCNSLLKPSHSPVS
jgi:hypothetical protein